jgi:ABC-type histidine transport system ATPase subunit
MDTDKPVIDIDNLHRRYGKLDAVNGLSLRLWRAGDELQTQRSN